MIETKANQFPIIYARFHGETTMEDADELESFSNALMERAVREDKCVVMLVDSLATGKVTAAVRRRFGELTQSEPPEWAARRLGSVVLLDSALIRGAITTVSWISPNIDVAAVKDYEGARRAVNRFYEEAGLPAPAGVEALAAWAAANPITKKSA